MQSVDEAAEVFAQGYTENDINRVLGRIEVLTGVRIECGWQFYDDCGYGGDSQLYVIENDEAHELAGDLWRWLWGGAAEAPGGPGDPRSWKGPRCDFSRRAQPQEDGFHNFAFEDRF